MAAGIIDRTNGDQVLVNEGAAVECASIVKVDIVATLLWQAQRAGKSLTAARRQLAEDAITDSNNAATRSLWTAIGGGTGLAGANRTFGLAHTTPGPGGSWGATRTTVSDQLRLLTVLTDPTSVLSQGSRDYQLGLMARVDRDQRWGVPAAASAPAGVYVKNGWLASPADHGLWVVNSIGRIVEPGHDWLVVALTNHQKTESGGISIVEHAAKVMVTGLRGPG